MSKKKSTKLQKSYLKQATDMATNKDCEKPSDEKEDEDASITKNVDEEGFTKPKRRRQRTPEKAKENKKRRDFTPEKLGESITNFLNVLNPEKEEEEKTPEDEDNEKDDKKETTITDVDSEEMASTNVDKITIGEET